MWHTFDAFIIILNMSYSFPPQLISTFIIHCRLNGSVQQDVPTHILQRSWRTWGQYCQGTWKERCGQARSVSLWPTSLEPFYSRTTKINSIYQIQVSYYVYHRHIQYTYIYIYINQNPNRSLDIDFIRNSAHYLEIISFACTVCVLHLYTSRDTQWLPGIKGDDREISNKYCLAEVITVSVEQFLSGVRLR